MALTTACGDDDAAENGGTAANGGSAGSGSGNRAGSGSGNMAGTGSGSTGSGDNVFGDYDCNGTPMNGSCDQTLCAIESSYDSLQSSCSGAGAASAICDALADCITDLGDCFSNSCPSGSMATAAAATCVSTASSCFISSASMGGG